MRKNRLAILGMALAVLAAVAGTASAATHSATNQVADAETDKARGMFIWDGATPDPLVADAESDKARGMFIW